MVDNSLEDVDGEPLTRFPVLLKLLLDLALLAAAFDKDLVSGVLEMNQRVLEDHVALSDSAAFTSYVEFLLEVLLHYSLL